MAKISVKAKQPSFETRANPLTLRSIDEAGNITAEQRCRMIAEAAYYRAEKRGFTGGDPNQDWLQAEMEIDRHLNGGPH